MPRDFDEKYRVTLYENVNQLDQLYIDTLIVNGIIFVLYVCQLQYLSHFFVTKKKNRYSFENSIFVIKSFFLHESQLFNKRIRFLLRILFI